MYYTYNDLHKSMRYTESCITQIYESHRITQNHTESHRITQNHTESCITQIHELYKYMNYTSLCSSTNTSLYITHVHVLHKFMYYISPCFSANTNPYFSTNTSP